MNENRINGQAGNQTDLNSDEESDENKKKKKRSFNEGLIFTKQNDIDIKNEGKND